MASSSATPQVTNFFQHLSQTAENKTSKIGKNVPVDLLSKSDIDCLKENIQQQHLLIHASHQSNPNFNWRQQWFNILSGAAIHDDRLQRLVIDKIQCPNSFASSLDSFRFNPLWVLGLRLPQSYDTSARDTLEKIMRIVDDLTPRILSNIEDRIKDLINSVSNQALEGSVVYRSSAAVTAPTKDAVDFLKLLKTDCRAQTLDFRTRMVLNDLQVLDLEACEQLRSFLAEDSEGEDHVATQQALERVTDCAITLIRSKWLIVSSELKPLPALTASDFEKVEVDYHRHEHNHSAQEGDQDPYEPAFNVAESETYVFEDAPLYKYVSRLVVQTIPLPKTYLDWGWPSTGALSSFAQLESGQAWWPTLRHRQIESEKPADVSSLPIDDLFEDSRDLSEDEARDISRGVGRAQLETTILEHMQHKISSQTSGEMENFKFICDKMCNLEQRPAVLKNLSNFDSKFTLGNETLFLDNWWHCRMLLFMTQSRNPISEDDYKRFELDILIVLAMIRGGTQDPILWLPVLDGLLVRVAKAYLSLSSVDIKEQSIRKALVQELFLFAHGASIAGLEVRFRFQVAYRNFRGFWYPLLYRHSPRCSNEYCMRLLPRPALFHQASFGRNGREHNAKSFVRGTFSTTTRESRLGNPAIRSFISVNRNHGYPCLHNWISSREPHPTLIVAYHWYAEIRHKDGCKAAQGKPSTNF